MQPQNLLLTTDFSDAARAAYPVAAAVARKFSARIHLVHVEEALPPLQYLSQAGISLDVPSNPYLKEAAARLEHEAEGQAALRGFRVESHLLFGGNPVEEVRKLERRAKIDLTVVATHGRTGPRHWVLGSFAERLVRYAAAPVLTTHPRDRHDGDFEPRTVLVPTDFSENARAVLPAIRLLAESYGAKMVFFHAIEPPPPFYGEAPSTFVQSVLRAMDEAPGRAQTEFKSLAAAELRGIDAVFETRQGRPAAAIVERAGELEADLIVIATHGRTGLEHFFLGSVAEQVVRKAPADVLTVRPRGTAS